QMGKRTALGLDLKKGAKEILAHVKGEKTLPTRRVVLPREVDVKRIRKRARMSQSEFALAFCINPRTLQEWEQGRRKPDATTRAYLAVIAKDREAVLSMTGKMQDEQIIPSFPDGKDFTDFKKRHPAVLRALDEMAIA